MQDSNCVNSKLLLLNYCLPSKNSPFIAHAPFLVDFSVKRFVLYSGHANLTFQAKQLNEAEIEVMKARKIHFG